MKEFDREFDGFVTDLDGTVIKANAKEVGSKEVINAFSAIPKDVYAIAATGRSTEVGLPITRELNLLHDSVFSNGAIIADSITGEVSWSRMLSGEQMRNVINAAVKATRDEGVKPYQMWTPGDGDPKKVFISIEDQAAKETCSAFIKDVPEKIARIIVGRIAEVSDANTFLSDAWNGGENMKDISIYHRLARKSVALEELFARYDIDPSRMIGVGDGVNDFDLFDAVGHPFAVDNADERLKKRARRIIPAQKDNGILEVINLFR